MNNFVLMNNEERKWEKKEGEKKGPSSFNSVGTLITVLAWTFVAVVAAWTLGTRYLNLEKEDRYIGETPEKEAERKEKAALKEQAKRAELEAQADAREYGTIKA